MVQLMPLHPKTPLLPHLNPDWFLPFWYRFTQVVLEKRHSVVVDSSECYLNCKEMYMYKPAHNEIFTLCCDIKKADTYNSSLLSSLEPVFKAYVPPCLVLIIGKPLTEYHAI